MASTVLAIIGAIGSGPTGGSAPPSDPASLERLADYGAAYQAAVDIRPDGQRCEAVAVAFARLSPADVLTGRNIRSSSAARIRKIAEGQRCSEAIAQSNERFSALQRAMAEDSTELTAEAARRIAAAYTGLIEFDRTRPRFASEGDTITRAKAIADAFTASQKRIQALTAAMETLQADHSPASYMQAENSLRALTDFDSSNLTREEERTVDAARQAVDTIGDSRTRLDQLPALVAAATGNSQNQDAERQLVAATAKISAFDAAVATPEQAQTLARARSLAAPFAWTILESRLAALAVDSSASNYGAVADAYKLLQLAPPAQGGEQTRLFEQARKAAEFLQQSDQRIQTMQAAVAAWNASGLSAKETVMSAISAVTPFDRTRFNDVQNTGWSTLQSADAVIRGPELGLTNSKSAPTPVFIISTASDRLVANSLIQEMQHAGFSMASTRTRAALVISISVRSVSDPELDTTQGPMASYRSTADLDVDARWVSDNSSLFEGTIAASSESNYADAKTQALIAAVTATASRFLNLAAK